MKFVKLLLCATMLVYCFDVQAVDTVLYRGKTIPIFAIEEAIHRNMRNYPNACDLNSEEQRAFMDCIYNYIIPKLKNGEITVKDDSSITYIGYITYFDHKWDSRKERRKHKLKYNPHKVGGYALNLLFGVLENVCWYQF